MSNNRSKYVVNLVPNSECYQITVYAENMDDAKEIVEDLICDDELANHVEGIDEDETYVIGTIE